MDFGYSIAGFMVGAIVGLTGVGGGSLMTPLLVLMFGIHPAKAVGTDLLYAAITKSGGTWVHAGKGTVDWKIAGLLAAGSMPATAITLLTVHFHAPGGFGNSTKLISVMLGIALLLTAASLVFRSRLIAWAQSRNKTPRSQKTTDMLTVATGITLGVLVSLSSVGAGALGVTALLFLYPTLPTVKIVGSDIAHAVPLTLVAGIGHWFMGSVDFELLGSLLIGSLPGIYIGSHLAVRIPEKVLRPSLAAILLFTGSKLIAN
ncbi:MAG: sulfite exporter TauE/SafE family protein [Rhodocyclaceae bacterium]|nr:sulfite exporter TauE/SafE family protein [Rhodocyclaceae bacterium]